MTSAASNAPLRGVVAVDRSVRSPAAAIATMLLADLGVDVRRTEQADGDPLTALPAHTVWLAGQRVISPDDPLVDTADVLIDTVHDEVAAWRPRPARQIHAVLTADPVAAADGSAPRGTGPVYGELAEAEYGFLHLQDGVRPGPIFLGWPHATYGAGWLLALGVVAALHERDGSGRGQVVTTSLADGLAVLASSRWNGGARLPLLNQLRSTLDRMGDERAIVALFRCADDRWLQVHTGPRGAFDRLIGLLGLSELVPPEQGAGLFGRPLDHDVADRLWEAVRAAFTTRPAGEWMDLLGAADICAMPSLPPGAALRLPQVAANDLVTTTADGVTRLHHWALFDPAPSAPERKVPSATGADDAMPLSGLTVVELAVFMAGPFTTRLLADLGATVIKVEEPAGDPMRHPLGAFAGVARGKQSIALNLKDPDDHATMLALLRRADVFVTNLRAGALERLGLGRDAVRALNPSIVHCHTSGYGNRGPWRDLPAFEPLHSALTGLLARAGGAGNPPAHYMTHMDYGCGLTAALAVVAALVHRNRTGEGHHVEVPQLAAGLIAMSDVHERDGVVADSFRLDAAQLGHAPTNALYRTGDGWLVLACGSEHEWQGVRRALGIDDTEWPGYARARAEDRSGSATGRAIARRLAAMPTAHAGARLDEHAVPWAVPKARSPQDIADDPRLRAHSVIVTETHQEVGEFFEVGHTLRFSRTGGRHTRCAPLLDQHRAEVLDTVTPMTATTDGAAR